MNIPEAVVKEASYLIVRPGDHLEYLGKIEDGRDAYVFVPSVDEDRGFPNVFLFDGDSVTTPVTSHDALDIIGKLSVE